MTWFLLPILAPAACRYYKTLLGSFTDRTLTKCVGLLVLWGLRVTESGVWLLWNTGVRVERLNVNISWTESQETVESVARTGPAAAQWPNWLGGGNRETLRAASQAENRLPSTGERWEGGESYKTIVTEHSHNILQTHTSLHHMSSLHLQPPTLPPST